MVRGRSRGTWDRDNIIVTGTAIEALALSHPIGFMPPMQNLSTNPEGFDSAWHFMQLVFDLPNPYTFPTLSPGTQPANASEVLARFIVTAEELAASTLLNRESSVTVAVNNLEGTESVDADLPSNEATRGFAVLFRQMHSPKNEPGSFQKAFEFLMDWNRRADDKETSRRTEELLLWARARRKLTGAPLNVWVNRMQRDRGWNDMPIVDDDGPSPEFLISRYEYGELIHWDRHRNVIAEWEADAFDGPWNRMKFLHAINGLSHIYLGFAELIRAATADRPESG